MTYTALDDAMIRSKSVPDAVIGQRIGRTDQAVRLRRRRLAQNPAVGSQSSPTRPTTAEREVVLRENIEALMARIVDESKTLRWLEHELRRKQIELISITTLGEKR